MTMYVAIADLGYDGQSAMYVGRDPDLLRDRVEENEHANRAAQRELFSANEHNAGHIPVHARETVFTWVRDEDGWRGTQTNDLSGCEWVIESIEEVF